MARTIKIDCPSCNALLIVDPSTGAVLRHEQRKSPGALKDLDQAMAEVHSARDRAEELFSQNVDHLAHQDEILEKRFKEAMKAAKKDKSPPPLRDIDLD
jgi:hypothetical protein